MTHRIPVSTLILMTLAGLAAIATPAAADPTAPTGAGDARRFARQILVALHDGSITRREARLLGDRSTLAAETDTAERGAGAAHQALVGTWLVDVPELDGARAFQALHTFGRGGTFVETSDLLGGLTEGPAHGVWKARAGRKAILSFELFVFENGEPVGRVRVRCRIGVHGDQFEAESVVDIVLPDGEEIRGVGGGPFAATRLDVQSP